MTNKEQIMIDGVDVSGCDHLVDKEACGSMECQSVECEKNPNCLFKQLSHKTQEYEELKEEYEAVKSESFTREELITLQEKDIDRYRKALEEIEGVVRTITETNKVYPLQNNLFKILDIIDKTKEKGGQ